MFGGGAQDLSTCAVYTFIPLYQSTVVTGTVNPVTGTVTPTPPNTPPAPPADPIAAQLLTGFAFNLGSVESAPTIADNFGSVAGSWSTSSISARSRRPQPIRSPCRFSRKSADRRPFGPISFGLVTSYPTLVDNFGSVNDAGDATQSTWEM